MMGNDVIPVTASVSTRGRYDTTLAGCLMGIAMQTKVPADLVIFYDDGSPVQLLERDPYRHIFRLLGKRGCNWQAYNTPKHGQVKNHQSVLDNAKYDFVWRIDDDNVPEHDVLETLYDDIMQDPEIGVVGGLVPNPSIVFKPDCWHSSKLVDNFICGVNSQWVIPEEAGAPYEVEHMYSTFLYRREAGKHGYHPNLSIVGHREETFFTYKMFLDGWKLLIDPRVKTWHLRGAGGGIHQRYHNDQMWDHDEQLFRRWLVELNIEFPKVKFCPLTGGIGDLSMFKQVLPELLEKYEGWRVIVACDHGADLFKDDPVDVINIDSARHIFGGKADCLDQFDTYRFAKDNEVTEDFVDVYRKLFVETSAGEKIIGQPV